MLAQGRHYMGKMNVECPFCKALHWPDERLSNSSLLYPRFGFCCLQGKIKRPPLQALPTAIQELYDGNDRRSKSFRKYMKGYNSTFAFTSLGVQLDDRVLGGRGPTSFTIHGELRHRTGSLLPVQGCDAVYSQLYIYDPTAALDIRQLRNPALDPEVLGTIQETLLACNKFSNDFRCAYEILHVASATNDSLNLRAYLHYSNKTDKRRYNLPSADEVAIVLPGDGSEPCNYRDIILHLKGEGNGLMQISECHPAYLPLHYVLMFPYGELGWSPELRRWDITTETTNDERLTQLDFYSYMLFERPSEYSPILRGQKLFQEFLVDAWAVTEQNKLRWFRNSQDHIRSELYQGLTDIAVDNLDSDQVGRRVVLPSSHSGSPRHMFEIFQDSMAITRYNKHPDIFLTMTANPKWPEVLDALLPHQNYIDRPDLVARVFEGKRKALMKEIKENGVFGCVVGSVFTIEFQKRGLPHMHALIYLKHPDKIHSITQVDRIVCAEFPDPDTEPELFNTVITCMIHGPCGHRNPRASCMENNMCTKRYPRAFAEFTTMDKDGYPIYRRPNNGKTYNVRGHTVDNRDVVPYNPYLSKMFNCHINVEVCAGFRCVKYIHKYIFKGFDRTTMVVNGDDEIQQYLDSRYIGPPEAAWRLFGFPMHREIPNVVRLALHLPGAHCVFFNEREQVKNVRERSQEQETTLTGFFKKCASDIDARNYIYPDFPQHYVWRIPTKEWKRRQRGFAIGRMYFARPNVGEIFFLRLLLLVVKGPRSFDDLKTVDNFTHATFKEACVARGLLEDDDEWIQCLQEASIMKTGHQLRRLFSIILLECNPLQPHALWDQFSEHLCDDLAHKIRCIFHIPCPSDDEIIDYGLFLLDGLLFESGQNLNAFPSMPQPKKIGVQLPTTS